MEHFEDTQAPERKVDAAIAKEIESGELEHLSLQELLTWTVDRFGSRLLLTCSFGLKGGIVIIHALHQVAADARVVTLDTGRLNQETHDLINLTRKTLHENVEIAVPDGKELERFVNENGSNAFYDSPELRAECCAVRKVRPLERRMHEVDAWITGLRREQNQTRANVRKVELDAMRPWMVKVNPIADWDEARVGAYLAEHSLPVNALHAQGFPTVGCAPCTRATHEGEHPRAGRWWWEDESSRECGLHVPEGKRAENG